YGGGTDQPRYPETGTLPLSPTTSDELDFTKYKIISTVSGEPDENATVNDNSITFTSTGERTVTLSVPGFGEDVVKAYAVNVNPASSSNPSANNASTIGSVAQTGVPVNAFVATLLMLMLGAGFVRVRGKMV
ncbi:MAG: hypothetical protein LBI63_04125, partial [Candidatus Ancillula sp.]|nr:hypothetical protein [Candidatus Ancillula sp.]